MLAHSSALFAKMLTPNCDHTVFLRDCNTTAVMSTAAMNKISPNSPSRVKPNEVETNIANALYDLETNIPEMRSALRPLTFVSAREVR